MTVLKLTNQQGSMLLLVMITIGVLSIFCVSFSSLITDLQKRISTTHAKSNRQYDIDQMITLMKIQNGLIDSAGLAENSELYVCLHDGLTPNCSGNCCLGNVEKGFYFLDPSDTSIVLTQKKKLSGPPEKPVYYNENGSFCTSPNPEDCSFSVTTSYIANCPGGEDSCSHAEHLKVKLLVKPLIEDLPSSSLKKSQQYELIYFVDRNYQPSIIFPDSLTLYLDDPEKEFDVSGDSGHPSEKQNFIFTKCLSENPDIAKITTPVDQPFSSGTSKIRLKGVALGSTKLTFQISDAGIENALSADKVVAVTVVPGISP